MTLQRTVRTLMACLLALAANTALGVVSPARSWQPTHYQLELRPDFAHRHIEGVLDMAFAAPERQGLEALSLDAGDLTIDAVTLGERSMAFEKRGQTLRIPLPADLKVGMPLRARIRYHGAPTAGLRFDADTRQVATAFSTSQWMPCLDDPAVRATFSLTLLLPVGMDFVQRHQFAWSPVYAGTGFSLLVCNLLYINQFPDRSADLQAGKRHWVARLAPRQARWGYVLIAIAAYLLSTIWIVTGRLPTAALVSLLALPLSAQAASGLLRHADTPANLAASIRATILAAILQGMLMSSSLIFSRF